MKGVKSHQYKNFKVDESEWPPKYWKLALKLEGDVSIAFSDPRRFARIRLQEEPAAHEPVSLLGFDPVLSMPTFEEFSNLVKARKTSLKALLLDQVSSSCILLGCCALSWAVCTLLGWFVYFVIRHCLPLTMVATVTKALSS